MKETHTYGPKQIYWLIEQDLYLKGKLATPPGSMHLAGGVTSFSIGQVGDDANKGQYTVVIVKE